ncbi:MFS general substrate transporter [Patellaria atrata CBS 101060]|uniref:MFS general substrate transporter n=1 Tax=Patellaria atrata CBS 101060 TaxID=1346257 RepID=A0A9P4SHX1_9PEZI|nr:MFS general substrate transporter [Patellaria atrata CBS 101060]
METLENENAPSKPSSPAEMEQEESHEARIERLGRERPAIFKTRWAEIGFVYSIVMSQVLTEYFVSGFNVVLPTITEELNIKAAQSTWPASAFSLVVACFLLTFGRLSDMYGGYPVYTAGCAWLALWSLIAGFSQNELMIDFCRAIQGLGPAAFLPSSLMLLGSVYRPGPRKNLVFSIYGACAPLGFYVGIFFAGVTAEYTTWGWYFWIGAILSLSTALTSYLFIPSDTEERKNMGIKMDWPGAILISSGLILLVFAITESSAAPNGWGTSYVVVTLIAGVIILSIAAYIEGWVVEMPLLPFDMFKIKYIKALILALFATYGSLGTFLLYSTFYTQRTMGVTPLQLVAWFTPMALGGCILSVVGGLILHLIPGTILVIISGIAWIVSPLLFALAPAGANYWAWIFPSMICATVAIDITFNVTNVFITTSMPLRRQGLAGALINSLMHIGIAFFLGFADVVRTQTEHQGERKTYKNVFWYEVGCAAFALVVLLRFVRIKKAKSDMTADEKAALEAAEGSMLQVSSSR